MDFFKKFVDNYQEGRRKDKEAAEQQAVSISALQRGELLPRAKERIEREKALGRNFFSSDLSVGEYLLCRESGFETIGQVMGSCFYNISLLACVGNTWGLTQSEYNHDKFVSNSGSLRSHSTELQEITDAQLKARQLAVQRLLLEAEAMDAHGVIGVRVKATHFNFERRLTEFTAIGTAIRIPGYQPGTRVFTSDLNGQEFWALYNAGYIPRELSFGVCSYYVKCDQSTRQVLDPTLMDWINGMSMQNQEIRPFTQGIYEARERAMERLSRDAERAQADGVVGVNVEFTTQVVESFQFNKTFHDPVFHAIATGTSIARNGEPKPVAKPAAIMRLRGGKWSGVESFGDYLSANLADDFSDDLVDE